MNNIPAGQKCSLRHAYLSSTQASLRQAASALPQRRPALIFLLLPPPLPLLLSIISIAVITCEG
jgi:hypothetical protein